MYSVFINGQTDFSRCFDSVFCCSLEMTFRSSRTWGIAAARAFPSRPVHHSLSIARSLFSTRNLVVRTRRVCPRPRPVRVNQLQFDRTPETTSRARTGSDSCPITKIGNVGRADGDANSSREIRLVVRGLVDFAAYLLFPPCVLTKTPWEESLTRLLPGGCQCLFEYTKYKYLSKLPSLFLRFNKLLFIWKTCM